jgi:hypothetical protein
MRRINRRIVILTLLSIAGVVAVAWWLVETQNRRMPALHVLLEEATQVFLTIDESRHSVLPHGAVDALFLADVWIRQGQPERAKAVLQKLLRVAKNFGCRCHSQPAVRLEVAQRVPTRWAMWHLLRRLATDALRDSVSFLMLSDQPEPLAAFFHQYLKVKSLRRRGGLQSRRTSSPKSRSLL